MYQTRKNINHYLKTASEVLFIAPDKYTEVKGRTLSAILSEIGGFDTKKYPARLLYSFHSGNARKYNYISALYEFTISIIE